MIIQFNTVAYIIKGHAVTINPAMIVNCKFISVKPHQALRSAHPNKAPAILHDAIYLIGGQAICHCVIRKTQRGMMGLAPKCCGEKKRRDKNEDNSQYFKLIKADFNFVDSKETKAIVPILMNPISLIKNVMLTIQTSHFVDFYDSTKTYNKARILCFSCLLHQ